MDKSTAGLFEQINYSSYFGTNYNHISLNEYFDKIFGKKNKSLSKIRLKIHSFNKLK